MKGIVRRQSALGFRVRALVLCLCIGSGAGLVAEDLRTSPVLALQIALDQAGFSSNALDGQWGHKSQVALATYCAVKGLDEPAVTDRKSARLALDTLFPHAATNLFAWVTVSTGDVQRLTLIPKDPLAKANLPAMGYQTILEMLAERGHLTETALRRLNPGLAWPNPSVGSRVCVPFFPDPKPPRGRKGDAYPRAASLRVSLGRFEITAFDRAGTLIALFPCSIAADKNKLPPPGEIQVVSIVPHPNYTYTPDRVPAGERPRRHIFPPGPNSPVGVAWIGLTLPGYGMHGTPAPERIGRAESHGCFRLANWNAQRLLYLCPVGTSVVIEN